VKHNNIILTYFTTVMFYFYY